MLTAKFTLYQYRLDRELMFFKTQTRRNKRKSEGRGTGRVEHPQNRKHGRSNQLECMDLIYIPIKTNYKKKFMILLHIHETH